MADCTCVEVAGDGWAIFEEDGRPIMAAYVRPTPSMLAAWIAAHPGFEAEVRHLVQVHLGGVLE